MSAAALRGGLLALLALASASASAGCGGASAGSPTRWQRYQAPAWGYAVDYPSDPKVLADDKGDNQTQISIVGDETRGKRIFGVVSTSADKLQNTASSAVLFDAMGAALARMLESSVGASHDVEIAGRQGREFEMTHIKHPEVKGKGRLVLDTERGRLYFVMMLADSAAGREDLGRFFGSFTITP